VYHNQVVVPKHRFTTGIISIVWDQTVSRQDQQQPYYVMDIAVSTPGLPGLFVSEIFNATLRHLKRQVMCVQCFQQSARRRTVFIRVLLQITERSVWMDVDRMLH